MKKFYFNLLTIVAVILCAACFAFGLAACGSNEQHTHTYSQTWSSDEQYHWKEPTCGDTTVPKDKAEHNFGTDNKCIVCGDEKVEEHRYSDWLSNNETHYKLDLCHNNAKVFEAEHDIGEGETTCTTCGYTVVEHKHTYGDWTWDTENHWQPATCDDTDEPFGFGAHVDENGDEVCDICPFKYEHVHTEVEDWTFDQTQHWKVPPCHPNELLEESPHDFADGICECGVKEIEVKVYAIYVEREGEKADSFAEWLSALAEAGVQEIRIVESGDVYYDYNNGESEVMYLAERTVQVQAVYGDTPVEDVWVMLTFYNVTESLYEIVDGTIALTLAKTDAQGLATLSFIPTFGYSDNYRVRVALAADVAAAQGIREEDAKPKPDRYVLKNGDGYIPFEVSETINEEALTLEFNFSAGWNGIEKFTLSYHRYYTNPLEGTGITDNGYTYTFKTSGNNLFDYFYFAPYYIPAGYAPFNYPTEQANKILENSYYAASGNYKISFTLEGTANATLYFWDENGVHLGAFHNTKSDGTPSDTYITSVSGGVAGTGKYTGGDFVNVGVSPNKATRNFQFGLICDSEVTVTLTVEYVGSYESALQYQIFIGEEGTGSVSNITLPQEDITSIGIINATAGLYKLSVYRSSFTKYAGQITAWTDTDKDSKTVVCEGYTTRESAFPTYVDYNGIIRLTEDTSVIYIENNFSDLRSMTISIEKYELPELTADQLTSIPASTSKMDETYDIRLDSSLSGTYELTIDVYGAEMYGSDKINGGEKYPLTVNIGNSTYTLNMTERKGSGTSGYAYVYSGTVTVAEGDNTISIVSQTNYSLFVRVLLKAS